MIESFTVKFDGRPIKTFSTKSEAREFLIWFTHEQHLQEQRFDLIDAAVDRSDLSQAKEVIKFLMEKK